jgi:hypothetical protein
MFRAFCLTILWFGFLSAASMLIAQVGIGTTVPHPSAVLDIASSTRGLLPPRLSQLQMMAIPTPADGLLVYNTTAGELFSFSVVESSWLPINNGWRRGGNAITSPATNWLGTTNAQALALRANNIERVRIQPTGNVGIGTTNPQALLHVNGSLRVGTNGTNVSNMLVERVSLFYLLVLPGIHIQNVTITGAQVGDWVVATKEDGNDQFVLVSAKVVSANTVEVKMRYLSGLSVTTTETLNITVLRP